MKYIICGDKVKTEFGIYCSAHKSRFRENITEQTKDNDKWIKIYRNSSLKSMFELAGLKDTMPDQAKDFRKLIKWKDIQSKNDLK